MRCVRRFHALEGATHPSYAESLTHLVQSCGFERCTVKGEQRYLLENHMYWLRHGQPGGPVKLGHLQDPLLAAAYAAMLDKKDMTDTLVIFAYKGL